MSAGCARNSAKREILSKPFAVLVIVCAKNNCDVLVSASRDCALGNRGHLYRPPEMDRTLARTGTARPTDRPRRTTANVPDRGWNRAAPGQCPTGRNPEPPARPQSA